MFVMKNEPRCVCVENGKHYQKFRRSDLRLPKMKDKLSAEDLDRVESFYEEIVRKKKIVPFRNCVPGNITR